MTTNLAAIVYVGRSTLYLFSCRNTLPQSKQSRQQKECCGTYHSDEQSLVFFIGYDESQDKRSHRRSPFLWKAIAYCHLSLTRR